MKIKLKNWYAVFSWQWDVPVDELCGICRVSFDGTCPTCKYPGDGCAIVIGSCQHAFHLHCIHKWLETEPSKGLCPMCRQLFELDPEKEINRGVTIPSYNRFSMDIEDEMTDIQFEDDVILEGSPDAGQPSR